MESPSRQKYFDKNARLLQKFHPLLALQMNLVDPSDIEFCNTMQNELNLIRENQGRRYFYHSPNSAKKEAQEWFEGLDLHTATVIFVYGIGLGYYYFAAKKWLRKNPHHHFIFLEQDPAVFYRLCETARANEILKDRQVSIHLFKTLDDDIFNELSWCFYECPFVTSSLKLYEELDPKGLLQLSQHISYAMAQKQAFVHEYLHYGVPFFRNFYPNLLALPQAYRGDGLFHCFQQIPAIICGAGPSLNKNMELLRQLQDKALIFAGGSALNALFPNEIAPHFGVAIDPNKSQYSRVAAAQIHPIPFFYRNRLFHEALKAIKGPRLYLAGSGGYDISHWFEHELNIHGEDLEEGHNVVNFSLQIAQALGCNPVILVGVDLALSNDRFYASGIAEKLDTNDEELRKKDAPDSETVATVDIYGQPVKTLWKWIEEAKWISHFAEIHPEINIINATEGGIGFEGISNLPLADVMDQYLTKPQESISKIATFIQSHSLSHIKTDQIFDLIRQMKESLDLCVVFLSKLIANCSQVEEELKSKSSTRTNLHSPHLAVIEGELAEEIGYKYLLANFQQVFQHTRRRILQENQSPKSPLTEKENAMKMLAVQKEQWLFLRDVAQVHREIIHLTVEAHV